MLARLKKIFVKETALIAPEEDDIRLSENPSFITDPSKIVKILQDMENGSPLCVLRIDGLPEEYNSSIIEIKPVANQIILDEMMPKQGNDIFSAKKKIKVSGFHKGIHLSFSLTHIEPGRSQGILYYKAQIPERIYYPQKRKAPRIDISSDRKSVV